MTNPLENYWTIIGIRQIDTLSNIRARCFWQTFRKAITKFLGNVGKSSRVNPQKIVGQKKFPKMLERTFESM